MVASDPEPPEVPKRGAPPVPRRNVAVRRNPVRFRAAGGGVAQTHGFSMCQFSVLGTAAGYLTE